MIPRDTAIREDASACPVALKNPASTISVSYTHLDVYKRQPLLSSQTFYRPFNNNLYNDTQL